MGAFITKHNTLQREAAAKIAKLIKKRGKESKHRNEQVLKIKDDQQFNLDGGSYLIEMTPTELIDNYGHSYSYDCLNLEQLCEIADSFRL